MGEFRPWPVSEHRDIFDAAERVACMDDDSIQTFAKHDPDIFRDIARTLLNGALFRKDPSS